MVERGWGHARRGSVARRGRIAAPLLVALLVTAALSTRAGSRDRTERRTAAAILAELDSVPYPSGVESDSSDELLAFEREVRECTRVQNRLALELHESHPDHPEVPRVLGARWYLSCTNLLDPASVLRETAAVLDGGATGELRRVALEERAFAAVRSEGTPLLEVERAVGRALALEEGRRNARLLWELASRRIPTPEGQRDVLLRLRRSYRSSPFAGDAALHHRLLERAGEPLPLGFEDALTGEPVTSGALRGREVVVLVARMRAEVDAPAGGPVRALARWQARGEAGDRAVACVWQTSSRGARERIARVTAETGIDWRVHLDDSSDPRESWVDDLRPAVTPLFLLLDAEGRLARASMRLATLFEQAAGSSERLLGGR